MGGGKPIAALCAFVAAIGLLAAGGLAAVTGTLAMNAAETSPELPPEIEAAYHQVGYQTGVPWTALAAWDAAENGFALPLPTVEQILAGLVHDRLAEKQAAAEKWCEEHPDEKDKCPPSPPELPPQEESLLLRQARQMWHTQLMQYVQARAAALAPHLAELDHDPESVYGLFLGADTAQRAAELMEGYLVLESLQIDADGVLISPVEPPAGWAPVDGFAWPVSAPITSRFGMRVSPIDGVSRLHAGIDLGAVQGAPIRAAMAGTVVAAEMSETYGLMVIVDHGDGYQTLYAHASALAVTMGQHVDQGQVVSYVGTTGKSTGPHLHFEIHYQGHPVDPLLLLTHM